MVTTPRNAPGFVYLSIKLDNSMTNASVLSRFTVTIGVPKFPPRKRLGNRELSIIWHMAVTVLLPSDPLIAKQFFGGLSRKISISEVNSVFSDDMIFSRLTDGERNTTSSPIQLRAASPTIVCTPWGILLVPSYPSRRTVMSSRLNTSSRILITAVLVTPSPYREIRGVFALDVWLFTRVIILCFIAPLIAEMQYHSTIIIKYFSSNFNGKTQNLQKAAKIFISACNFARFMVLLIYSVYEVKVMNIITVTLNPAIDVHVSEDENGTRKTERHSGGKGINVSRTLTCFGVESLCYTVVGEENKDSFLLPLTNLNIMYDVVKGKVRENVHYHLKSGPEPLQRLCL